MYQDWNTSKSYVFKPFHKYYTDFRDLCVSEIVPNRDAFFLLKSSVNRCKEEIRTTTSQQLKLMADGRPPRTKNGLIPGRHEQDGTKEQKTE
jgi:hypothetical protein